MRRLAPLLMVSALLILAGCGDANDPAAAPDPAEAVGQTPVMPADAPPQEEPVDTVAPGDAARDCLTAIGKAAADRLVERCIAVSPATRPPCNVANPCDLIQGEIDRACGQYGPGEDKPAECSA